MSTLRKATLAITEVGSGHIDSVLIARAASRRLVDVGLTRQRGGSRQTLQRGGGPRLAKSVAVAHERRERHEGAASTMAAWMAASPPARFLNAPAAFALP